MEIPKPSRRCCASGREFLPGEMVFSTLIEDEGLFLRQDYAEEQWPGPAEDGLGWWKTRLPEGRESKPRITPNEQLLDLFTEWRFQPEKADMLYVLTLLLIRRRLFRYDREEKDEDGRKILLVTALKDDAEFGVAVAVPSPERLREIQEQLSQLL